MKTTEIKPDTMLDITCIQSSDFVEISIREDDKVVWINVNGQCLFRISKIQNLVVHRGRKSFVEKSRLEQ